MSHLTIKSLSSSSFPDEQPFIKEICARYPLAHALQVKAKKLSSEWITQIRKNDSNLGTIEKLLRQFPLNSAEGNALMNLAEALLRIPDAATSNAIIQDKIAENTWESASDKKTFETQSALTGLIIGQKTLSNKATSFIAKPIIRSSVSHYIKKLSNQFVLGENIDDAFIRAAPYHKKGYRLSYDMLGEGARTKTDSEHYFNAYKSALHAIGRRNHAGNPKNHSVRDVPGISVKLSALHPRYHVAQKDRCIPEISEKLLELASLAAKYNIALTVDAEETERLTLSLQIIEETLSQGEFGTWEGFGLAVQAYQKRALSVIDWAQQKSELYRQKLQIRLVKGAYWDREIKHAQAKGLSYFPVFTRKYHTDINYIACAQKLFEHKSHLYPMFATHNAHTLAVVLQLAVANDSNNFEFQRLHGMGGALYDTMLAQLPDCRVSIYAPVGPRKDLLPYLVRRLLENGANSSFINQLLDETKHPDTLSTDPYEKAAHHDFAAHPKIALGPDLYRDEFKQNPRQNSLGIDLEDEALLNTLQETLTSYADKRWSAANLIAGKRTQGFTRLDSFSPAHKNTKIGSHTQSIESDIDRSIIEAQKAFKKWNSTKPSERAKTLHKAAAIFEKNASELMALLITEAGKTMADAHDEIREAVDFLRYYAGQLTKDNPDQAITLPGPAGEKNEYRRTGRGVFACISPWNFPLAIFTGQIAAALAAGNSVIAKPAEQTPLIADLAVKLLQQSGIPKGALNLIIGAGDIGDKLVNHPEIAGVAFTGSGEAARSINQSLASRTNGIIPLIAETGGLNAMIADSSALLEQVVDDVVRSAFGSAGQRCSALRVLCVQDDIAPALIRLLGGAIRQLKIGPSENIDTDIGPIIDDEALNALKLHRQKLDGYASLLAETPLDPALEKEGHYFAPCLYELPDLHAINHETFGPILHLVRYKRRELDDILEQINAKGYGLTLGIHSRVESFIDKITQQARVGNLYVNRSMIGAVVGSQPFGGMGLSGTGPKAGGPDYLKAFMSEQVISTDITATGGNASLVSLED